MDTVGITGSIAEKDDVREVRTPKILMTDDDQIAWASSLLHEEIADSQWEWINDKWGPAAAGVFATKGRASCQMTVSEPLMLLTFPNLPPSGIISL